MGRYAKVKYGTWNVAMPEKETIDLLCEAGYNPLTAHILCGRGIKSAQEAQALLDCHAPLPDPFLLREMDTAVRVIERAMENHVKIGVFGDYDVDGITATCLLTDYLRSRGACCVTHIPGRLEEGYGLNESAIRALYAQGVRLIVTVDCGITAVKESALCAELGMELVITDHHECKQEMPKAAAVVDPHRNDRTYPHTDLSGVGIAFKLASALEGDQERIAARYCDLVCLGTIADVMPLRGENRRLVVQGMEMLRSCRRLGLRALMQACECDKRPINSATIGFILAPRINAAGRMEHAELAVRLFLTQDPEEAARLAHTLCDLNRERQETETTIYREATAQLKGKLDSAIVLSGETWHQGVVGIVASRLSEEYCRPAILICLNGDCGKASSRSYGGFNLFASLSSLSDLLEGYGGHELAAGFTIERGNIEEFRRRICRQVDEYCAAGKMTSALRVDCQVPPSLLTVENIEALSQLEPCGTGCPRPVLCLNEVLIERFRYVGKGKHLRLQLRTRQGIEFQAIFFSAGALCKKLRIGQRVDVAFQAQINEYHGAKTVQLNLLDLRSVSPTALYERYCRKEVLDEYECAVLAPERRDVADVWNCLRAAVDAQARLRCELTELCTAVARSSRRHSIRRTAVCLDILAELGLLAVRRKGTYVEVQLRRDVRNPLENSTLYRTLHEKGGDHGNF